MYTGAHENITALNLSVQDCDCTAVRGLVKQVVQYELMVSLFHRVSQRGSGKKMVVKTT